jgi:ABC-type transport system involved in cytochrome c biogenesis permease subunit
VTLSAPYPNPATSPFWPIRFDLRSNCSKTLHWTITTSANRLVVSGTVSVFGRGTLVWDQRDNRGKLVANGLYYFRLLEAGQPDQRARIFILR